MWTMAGKKLAGEKPIDQVDLGTCAVRGLLQAMVQSRWRNAMIIHNAVIKLSTRGFSDCHDITGHLDKCLGESGVDEGLLTVMNPGSTGAVTTIEFESGAVNDLK
jgi:hypothetical protein